MGRRIGNGRLKNGEVSDSLEEETGFVWDGSHLLQEIQPDSRYTYIYANPDSYEPLAQVHNSLLQKDFIEIKLKLRRTINFVRPIGKTVHRIILEVVKIPRIERTNHERIIKHRKKLNILFPQSYKNTLDKFKSFMEIEFKDYEIDLFNNNLLFDELNSFPRWNYMEYLVEINKKKQKAENIVQRHDSTEFVDAERVKKGFMFGSSSDGGRLYFDLNDNLSIWEYWLDDGSIGKVADTFDEILEYGETIDYE